MASRKLLPHPPKTGKTERLERCPKTCFFAVSAATPSLLGYLWSGVVSVQRTSARSGCPPNCCSWRCRQLAGGACVGRGARRDLIPGVKGRVERTQRVVFAVYICCVSYSVCMYAFCTCTSYRFRTGSVAETSYLLLLVHFVAMRLLAATALGVLCASSLRAICAPSQHFYS